MLFCVTRHLMPSLLPRSDESAMNFEGLGVSFGHVYCSAQHFCELGVNFAESM